MGLRGKRRELRRCQRSVIRENSARGAQACNFMERHGRLPLFAFNPARVENRPKFVAIVSALIVRRAYIGGGSTREKNHSCSKCRRVVLIKSLLFFRGGRRAGGGGNRRRRETGSRYQRFNQDDDLLRCEPPHPRNVVLSFSRRDVVLFLSPAFTRARARAGTRLRRIPRGGKIGSGKSGNFKALADHERAVRAKARAVVCSVEFD